MTPQEMVQLIERDFEQAYAPMVTKIEYYDGSHFAGFFQRFDDSKELKSKYLFRFIPANKAYDFQQDFDKTKVPNKDYSFIIDSAQIKNIEQVDPRQ